MAIDNRSISALRENMSLADLGRFTPKPLLDFGNKLGMYNVDVLLDLFGIYQKCSHLMACNFRESDSA